MLSTPAHILILFTPLCLHCLSCSFMEWKVERCCLFLFCSCWQCHRSLIDLDITWKCPAEPVEISSGCYPLNLLWSLPTGEGWWENCPLSQTCSHCAVAWQSSCCPIKHQRPINILHLCRVEVRGGKFLNLLDCCYSASLARPSRKRWSSLLRPAPTFLSQAGSFRCTFLLPITLLSPIQKLTQCQLTGEIHTHRFNSRLIILQP